MAIDLNAAAPGGSNLPANLAAIIGGIGSLVTARGDMGAAREASGVADPFSGERGAYMTSLRNYMGANPVDPSKVTGGTNDALSQLMHFMQDPSSIRSNPVYQAGLGFGTEAVNRGAGASGMLNSGNRLIALDKFGQDYGMGFQNQIYNQLLGDVGANVNAANLGLNAQNQGYGQLAQLSGANTGSPGSAAAALMAGRQNQAGSIGSGIGGIANGAAGLFSNPSFINAIRGMTNGGGMSGSFGGEMYGTGGDSGILDPSLFTGYNSGGIDLLSGGYGPDPYMDLTSLFGP